MPRPVHVFLIFPEAKVNDVAPLKAEHSNRPSIAVVPFTNMSGDPDQQFFSDGITEDIITELSRFRSLFVIARNSAFQYRDKAVDVRRIGRELGVQYVVEGSVRKMGGQVRITAQLIHTVNGNHLWADRYDRPIEDLFAVQDELVQTLAATVEGRLVADVAELAKRKPTKDMAAYECVLKGRELLGTYNARAAEPLLMHAMQLDPSYAQACAFLGCAKVISFFDDPRPELLDEALVLNRQAVSLDNSDAMSHSLLGVCYKHRREFDLAGIHFDRAIKLNPNDALIILQRAAWLARVGRHRDALQWLDVCLARDPFPPNWYWEVRAAALFPLRRYAEVVEAVRSMSDPFWWNRAYLAAAHAQLGEMEMAAREAKEVLRVRPNFSISWYLLQEPYKNATDAEPLMEGLRKSGFPE